MSDKKSNVSDTLKAVLKSNTMLFVLVGVMILFEVLIRITGHGSLFAPANVTNIIRQNAYVAILATGMLLCILTGGNIDLSVGSVVALVGALAGVFIVNWGWPIWLAVIACLILGTAIGAFHGFFIAYIHIPPFITTYLNLFESYLPGVDDKMGEFEFLGRWVDKYTLIVTLIVTAIAILAYVVLEIISRRNKIKKNYTVQSRGSFIAKLVVLSIVIFIIGQFLARDRGLPVVLILLGVIIAAYSYFTQNTVPGRYLYAIGGNEKAARLSGVNTNNVMFFAYTNMGFIAAVAALVTIARMNSAQPTAGQNYEMDAIASCFIGGASAYGGTGTVGGAVVGAIFMGVLNNGMSILGVDMNWQRAVKGMVLLAAVIFDVMSKRKKASKKA